jgi:Ca2+-binding EF-hand superfamily protein
MLQSADRNKDGLIARDEFLAARAERFSKMDRNADGFLDEADRRQPDRQARRGAMLRERFDANSDGKFSKDEFVNGAAFLFDRADTDGNALLDAKEIESVRERREHALETRKHPEDRAAQ